MKDTVTKALHAKSFCALGAVIIILLTFMILPAGSRGRRKGTSVVVLELSCFIVALKEYQVEFKSLPVGNDAEIAKSLMGNNEKQMQFLEFKPSRIDSEGRILDPWGTPYKFVISNTTITVSSAGKNKKFSDSDDVVKSGDASK
jgi:hypothetical protein